MIEERIETKRGKKLCYISVSFHYRIDTRIAECSNVAAVVDSAAAWIYSTTTTVEMGCNDACDSCYHCY